MRLLLADIIRRTPIWTTSVLVILFALGWWASTAAGQPSLPFAVSLTMAFALGPMTIASRAQTPVIPYLPVSRRDVWRSIWVVSTVGATLVMLLVKLPVAMAVDSIGWPTLALSGLMDFLYTGCGCALAAIAGLGIAPAAKPGPLHRLVRIAAGFAFFGGVVWAFSLRRALPTHWSDLTPLHGIAFGAAAALTLVGYLHTPGFGSSTRRRMPPSRAKSRGLSVVTGRLSGLPRLLAHELAWSVTMAIMLLVLFLGIGFASDHLMGRGMSVSAYLKSQLFFIFDLSSPRLGERGFDPFDQMGWFAVFAASVSFRFPEMVRHLRVLPIRRSYLHLLLIGWPTMIWAGAWVALATVGWLAADRPFFQVFRLELILALAGLSALAQSVVLRFPRWPHAMMAAGPIAMPFLKYMLGISSWTLIAIATASLAAAVVLHRIAFARSATYRRVPAAAGFKTESI